MRVYTSTKFRKQFKKQTKEVQQRALKQEQIFLKDLHDPRVDTHKLHGKDKKSWAYSVNHGIRIKFTFISSDIVMYLEIGTHNEVY